MRVSIVGASGYTGGEILRLLVNHPEVEIGQAISHTYAGQPVRRHRGREGQGRADAEGGARAL